MKTTIFLLNLKVNKLPVASPASWNSISQRNWSPFLKRELPAQSATSEPVWFMLGRRNAGTFRPGENYNMRSFEEPGEALIHPSDDQAHLCLLHRIGVGGTEVLLEVFCAVIWPSPPSTLCTRVSFTLLGCGTVQQNFSHVTSCLPEPRVAQHISILNLVAAALQSRLSHGSAEHLLGFHVSSAPLFPFLRGWPSMSQQPPLASEYRTGDPHPPAPSPRAELGLGAASC